MAQIFGAGIVPGNSFHLSKALPLDGKFVVATIEDRDAHVTGNRAYDGMLVYVEADKKTYQYIINAEGVGAWEEFGFNDDKFDAKLAATGLQDAVDTNTSDISTMKGQIDALEKGTYDDTEVRNLISGLDDTKADKTQVATDITAAKSDVEGQLATTKSGLETKIGTDIASAKSELEGKMATDIASAKSDVEGQIASAKSELEGKITKASEDAASALAGEVETLEGAIGDLEDAVDAKLGAFDYTDGKTVKSYIDGQIEVLVEGVDADKVDGIKELIDYVDKHGATVQGLQDAIDANAEDIADLTEAHATDKEALEASIATKADATQTATDIATAKSGAEATAKAYTDAEVKKITDNYSTTEAMNAAISTAIEEIEAQREIDYDALAGHIQNVEDGLTEAVDALEEHTTEFEAKVNKNIDDIQDLVDDKADGIRVDDLEATVFGNEGEEDGLVHQLAAIESTLITVDQDILDLEAADVTINEAITNLQNNKADKSTTYTKTEVDGLVEGAKTAAQTYVDETVVPAIDAKLDLKADNADLEALQTQHNTEKAELEIAIGKKADQTALTALANDHATDKAALEGAIATKAEATKVAEDIAAAEARVKVVTDALAQADTDNKAELVGEIAKKATKATTLAGYEIADAYTKDEVNTELAKKADNYDIITTGEIDAMFAAV